ncbi:hypothetical protein [Acinetobacter haemolyticus]|uniref:DUF7940 domain-containing protein n=1 Tax=Acinetobacter haemolyticus TaxID=29430 RepID=UPI000F747626|nr:hypothetical protein [Acinetobacter haemolyticus]RSN77912.1 hypothetical protein EA769_03575 [Acinetobacter haemolyticus]
MPKVNRPFRPLAQLNKVERHISNQVQMSNVIDRLYEEHGDKLDYSWKEGYETGVRDTNAVCKPKIEEQKTQLLEQAKKHQARVSTLKNEIDFLSLVNAKDDFLFEPQRRFLVENWRNGWKWFSTWMFALITIVATVPIPPELLAALPEHFRLSVIAAIAICGGILRHVNQTKPLPYSDSEGGA